MHSAITAETWTSAEMPTSPTMRPQTGTRGRQASCLIPTPISCPIPTLPFHISPSIFVSQFHYSSYLVSFPFSHSISCLIPRPLWCCSHCNNPYNRDHIEQSLIDAVQRRSMSVVLQDLVCTKCQGVRQTCRYTQGFV